MLPCRVIFFLLKPQAHITKGMFETFSLIPGTL